MRLPKILRTVTFRLAITQAVLFALCAAVLFGVVYSTVIAYARHQLKTAVSTEFSALAGEEDPAGVEELTATIAARSRDLGSEGHSYRLQSADGQRLAGTMPAMDLVPEWRELRIAGNAVLPPDDEPHSILVQARPLPFGGALFVGRDMRDLAELKEVLQQTFAVTTAATLALAILGGAITSRGYLRRVEAVNATTRTIIEGGDIAARIPVQGTQDEFDRLAVNLNAMLARIQALMEGLRQVSNDIAHDLRTPLTHLRQRLELARTEATTIPQYDAVVEATIADTDAILKTFAALLRIAQVEAGTRRTGFTELSLSELCAAIAEIYGPVAEDNGQQIRASLAPNVWTRGDRELLTQLLANLVENAIRHTPGGTRISLTLRLDQNPSIVVADEGPGIPAAVRPHVFRRFFRGDHSRSSDGTGLGLSLVRAVADLHDISIDLQENNPGLRVSLNSRAENSRSLCRTRCPLETFSGHVRP